MLRPSLAAAQAGILAKNLTRGVDTVRLFELGTVFTGSTTEVHEDFGLSLGATGGTTSRSLHRADDALFFEVKGALEQVFAKFEGVISFAAETLPSWIEPGCGATVSLGGKRVAIFGELSAAVMQKHKLKQTCVVAEVKAQVLLDGKLLQPTYREVSRYKGVERDFSFLFPDSVRWQSVADSLRGLNIVETQEIAPLEIFRDPKGKAIAMGSYSLLTRVVFQSGERTLTEEEISGWSDRVTAALTALGGVQRA